MSNLSLKEQLQAVVGLNADRSGRDKQRSTKPMMPSVRQANRQKPKWLEHALYGIALLKVYFPNCFHETNSVKPLKKGIKQDLVKTLGTIDTIVTEDKACMLKSLTYYVNTASYHKQVVEGATRIDLDGNPSGVVTAEEAKYAIDRQLAKRQARQVDRSKAQVKDSETTT